MCFKNLPIEFNEEGNPVLKKKAACSSGPYGESYAALAERAVEPFGDRLAG